MLDNLDAVGKSDVPMGFAKSEGEEFSLEDDCRSGKPSNLDDVLKATKKIEENSNTTITEHAEMLEVSLSPAREYLVKQGYISRYNIWALHTLSVKNCLD